MGAKMKPGKAASGGFPSKRQGILIAGAVLVAAAGVWGVTARHKPARTTVALPKELSPEVLKSEDPHKAFETIHNAMRDNKLTEEQRHQVFQNMRSAMEERMDNRVNTWMQANAVEKDKLLDKDLDEMQAHMKDFQQRREQWQRERAGRGASGAAGASASPGGGPGGAPSGQAGGGGGGGGPGGHRDGAGPSRQERKERFEARNPDESAKRMAYFSALRQRAQQRGIQMPFGGPGGPGGPGGH